MEKVDLDKEVWRWQAGETAVEAAGEGGRGGGGSPAKTAAAAAAAVKEGGRKDGRVAKDSREDGRVNEGRGQGGGDAACAAQTTSTPPRNAGSGADVTRSDGEAIAASKLPHDAGAGAGGEAQAQAQAEGEAKARVEVAGEAKVHVVSRSTSPQWGSIRSRPDVCTYAPWRCIVRVDDEIKKATHPKIITALSREQAPPAMITVIIAKEMASWHWYASRAVKVHPHGGQFDLVWPPACTPDGGASCVW